MSHVILTPLVGDGIHDDTEAIQQRLDCKTPTVYLPLPLKNYLISRTLKIHSNQSLVLDRFTVIRLAPKSDCLMLSNAEEDGDSTNISIVGGIWDMDNMSQTPNPMCCNAEELAKQKVYRPDTYLGIVMRFISVKNLYLKSLTFKDPVTFCVQLAKVYNFTVDDVTFDFNMGNPVPGNMDGIHVDGGCRFGRITNLKGTTYDDLIALNADDGLDSPCFGPIEDITIDGLYAEGCHSAIRMLSNSSWVRRISVANVYGTYYQYVIGITNIYPDEPSDGLFDAISIRNIYASKAERLPVFLKDDHPVFPIVWVERGARVGALSISELHRREDCVSAECIAVAKGAMIDWMSVADSSYKNETGQTAAFMGNEGDIGVLTLRSVHAWDEKVLDNCGNIGELHNDVKIIHEVPSDIPPLKPRWRY